MNNHRPRSLRREFRRWLLIPRARRVRNEREFQELDEFLERIREAQRGRPYWQREAVIYPDDDPRSRHGYADEVG